MGSAVSILEEEKAAFQSFFLFWVNAKGEGTCRVRHDPDQEGKHYEKAAIGNPRENLAGVYNIFLSVFLPAFETGLSVSVL